MAGGDIEDPYRPPLLRQARHRLAQRPFKMPFANANTTPAYRVQILPVDELPERRGARWPAAVNVIERAAGVEARPKPKADPFGQAPDGCEKSSNRWSRYSPVSLL